MDEDRKKPVDWARQKGFMIMDPDGWRAPHEADFDAPITEKEFDWRARRSTNCYRDLLVNKRHQLWAKAAQALLAGRGPRARKKREESLPSFVEFLTGPAGAAARNLLGLAKTYILLTESEACMGRSTSYVLDHEGLCRSIQVVGIAAAYTHQKPQLTYDVTPLDVLQAASSDSGLSEEQLMEDIYQELDEIANRALYK